jgi:hypothetical protein
MQIAREWTPGKAEMPFMAVLSLSRAWQVKRRRLTPAGRNVYISGTE